MCLLVKSSGYFNAVWFYYYGDYFVLATWLFIKTNFDQRLKKRERRLNQKLWEMSVNPIVYFEILSYILCFSNFLFSEQRFCYFYLVWLAKEQNCLLLHYCCSFKVFCGISFQDIFYVWSLLDLEIRNLAICFEIQFKSTGAWQYRNQSDKW